MAERADVDASRAVRAESAEQFDAGPTVYPSITVTPPRYAGVIQRTWRSHRPSRSFAWLGHRCMAALDVSGAGRRYAADV